MSIDEFEDIIADLRSDLIYKENIFSKTVEERDTLKA